MDTHEKLSVTSIVLHWSVAILVCALVVAGFVMVNAEVWSLYPLHKSFGVLAAIIIAARIVWRWRHGFPPSLSDESSVATRIARLMHIALLVLTVFMPISGMLFSGASGHGFSLFGLTIVPPNIDPLDADNVLPYNEAIAEGAQTFHQLLGYLLCALLALHVFAAFKHHFIDRDRLLLRMFGR